MPGPFLIDFLSHSFPRHPGPPDEKVQLDPQQYTDQTPNVRRYLDYFGCLGIQMEVSNTLKKMRNN